MVTILVVPAAAGLMALREPERYQASARVLVNPQNLAASLENIQDPTLYDKDRNVRTQVELARTPTVAGRTIKAAGLEGWDPSMLLGISSVSAGTGSDILTFSVTHAEPDLATALATEYARQYIRYRRELDTSSLMAAEAAIEKRISSLRRTGGEKSRLFEILLDRQQQLEILQTLQTARAILIRRATGAVKVQPTPARSVVLGAGLGVLLALGLVVLLEALDSRVRSSESIAHRLGLRLLARIPAPPRGLGEKGLVMIGSPNTPGAEAYRILATNLEFSNIEEGARSILFTSAVAKEGKTTTVANLAIALARAGRRVVLLDLDLRSASIHELFGVPQSPGLTDVVLRGVDMEKSLSVVETGSPRTYDGWALRRVSEGRLEILPTGRLPSAPGDVVARIPLGPMLDFLKDRCDIVLIDGPPALQVGDTMAVSPAVDAVVVIARLGVVRAPMLGDMARTLRDCPAPILGVVITDAEVEAEYGYYTDPRERRGVATLSDSS